MPTFKALLSTPFLAVIAPGNTFSNAPPPQAARGYDPVNPPQGNIQILQDVLGQGILPDEDHSLQQLLAVQCSNWDDPQRRITFIVMNEGEVRLLFNALLLTICARLARSVTFRSEVGPAGSTSTFTGTVDYRLDFRGTPLCIIELKAPGYLANASSETYSEAPKLAKERLGQKWRW